MFFGFFFLRTTGFWNTQESVVFLLFLVLFRVEFFWTFGLFLVVFWLFLLGFGFGFGLRFGFGFGLGLGRLCSNPSWG